MLKNYNNSLKSMYLESEIDDSDNVSPGFKFT